MKSGIIFPRFSKYTPHWKMLQIRVVDFNKVCILFHVSPADVLYNELFSGASPPRGAFIKIASAIRLSVCTHETIQELLNEFP
jgi:hypothetical protein